MQFRRIEEAVGQQDKPDRLQCWPGSPGQKGFVLRCAPYMELGSRSEDLPCTGHEQNPLVPSAAPTRCGECAVCFSHHCAFVNCNCASCADGLRTPRQNHQNGDIEHYGDDTPKMVMTPLELKRAMKALGWSNAELGRRTSSHPNTVGRWAKGDTVPGPVAAFVALALEVQRLHAAISPSARR